MSGYSNDSHDDWERSRRRRRRRHCDCPKKPSWDEKEKEKKKCKWDSEEKKKHSRESDFCEKKRRSILKAKLNPKEEVFFSLSKASGKFIAVADEDCILFKLLVWDIEEVTEAHIHLGKRGQDGPAVAFLFPTTDPTGPIDGLLAKGVITKDDLLKPLKDKPLKKLLRLIKQGKAYVNVHTDRNPQGEIRGQIETIHY